MKKKTLLSALKLIRPALGNSNLIPGLDCFHIKDNTISAFNGGLYMSTIIEEEELKNVKGSVTGESFFKLVSALGEDITLELTDFPAPMENLLTVKSGKSKTSFPNVQMDLSFTEKAPEESTTTTSLPTSVLFAAGLKRCLASMGGKGTLTAEAGISVFIENNTCRMYSNNGISFSRFVFPLQNPTEDLQVFLPAAFCEQLLFLYSELGREPLTITITEKYVLADFSSTMLRSSFHANPVDIESCKTLDVCIEKIPTVPLSKEISEAVLRSEIITADGTIDMDYGLGDKLIITAGGKGSQQLVEEIDLPYPAQGSIKIEVRGFKKALDTSKQIGMDNSFIVLIGAEDYYNHLIVGRE